MNGKMRSCVMGLLLGQFSSPLPMAQKEPVAYLYNGVRLPALPEWDREMYPYAYIIEKDGASVSEELAGEKYYTLAVTQEPILYSFASWKNYLRPGTTYLLHRYTPSQRYRDYLLAEWGESLSADDWSDVVGPATTTQGASFNGESIWTNSDMYDSADELRLTASDPIPVYDKE